jgi:NADH-quinone oxidoreductase subunit E/NADP-reducing hydrogenase subunit HndA
MEGSILIVDDDPIVVKSCEYVLKPEGYDVTGVTRVKEAMGVLVNQNFDLILTDLKMPEIDGVKFISMLKEKNIKAGIIVITGYPSQESLKDTLEMGIIDYVPKPFSPSILLDVVAKGLKFMLARANAAVATEDATTSKADDLKKMINSYKHTPGALIPVLQKAQELIGYLPPSVQRIIAKEMRIPVSEVHGVVSFYSYFTMKPRGKHSIRVCLGTACYVKQANEILEKLKGFLHIEAGGITDDRKFSLETVRCLGACGLAPVVVIDGDTYGAVDPVRSKDLLNDYD